MLKMTEKEIRDFVNNNCLMEFKINIVPEDKDNIKDNIFINELKDFSELINKITIIPFKEDNDKKDWTDLIEANKSGKDGDEEDAIDKYNLIPKHPCKIRIKISIKFLSIILQTENVLNYILKRIAIQLVPKLENAILNGNGIDAPFGYFNDKFKSRDVLRGMIGIADHLIESKYSIPSEFRNEEECDIILKSKSNYFNKCRIARDGSGNKIYSKIGRCTECGSESKNILNYNILDSEYIPDTHNCLMVNLEYYWFVFDPIITLKTSLNEENNNMINFDITLLGDGIPVINESFVRLPISKDY